MVRILVRTVVFLAVLVGLIAAVALRMRRPGRGGALLANDEWPSVPTRTQAPEGWVEPEGRACPASHPVKAKLSSGRFHMPGMAVYDRTIPDRCYATPEAAEVDGLQRAKH
jgi:hypothetical protein